MVMNVFNFNDLAYGVFSYREAADLTTWNDVELRYPERWRKIVHELAESSLPNEFFLQRFYPFHDDSCPQVNLKHSIFQEGCLYVLVLRGFPCIESVKDYFLYYFGDINEYGLGIAYRFIKEHSNEFSDSIRRVLRKTLTGFCDEWFSYVFDLAKECFPLSEEERAADIGGLTDDGTWETSVLENFAVVMKVCGITDPGEQEEIRRELIIHRAEEFADDRKFLSELLKKDQPDRLGDFLFHVFSNYVFLSEEQKTGLREMENEYRNGADIYDSVAARLPFFMKLCGTEGRTEEFEKILAMRKEKNKLTDPRIKR